MIRNFKHSTLSMSQREWFLTHNGNTPDWWDFARPRHSETRSTIVWSRAGVWGRVLKQGLEREDELRFVQQDISKPEDSMPRGFCPQSLNHLSRVARSVGRIANTSYSRSSSFDEAVVQVEVGAGAGCFWYDALVAG